MAVSLFPCFVDTRIMGRMMFFQDAGVHFTPFFPCFNYPTPPLISLSLSLSLQHFAQMAGPTFVRLTPTHHYIIYTR